MPGKKDPAKPKGRMSAYAYFVQACREEQRRTRPDDKVIFTEFSKICGERWKTMDENAKEHFKVLADQDKKRHNVEMQSYVPPPKLADGKKQRKKKVVVDPNAPKRPLSAFFWFSNDERSKIKAMNPELSVGGVAKELGRLWGVMEPATKQAYQTMAERDKARYVKESAAYKMRLAQGVSSTAGGGGGDEDDDDEEDDYEMEYEAEEFNFKG